MISIHDAAIAPAVLMDAGGHSCGMMLGDQSGARVARPDVSNASENVVAAAHESPADGAPLEPVGHGGGMEAAVRVAQLVADYLANLESHAVLPQVAPGSVRRQIPASAPAQPEALETILADYQRLIEPNLTHWQHPGFMAYFPSVATWPGILGEWLSAGLNSNVMLWRNAPASTELEEVVVAWLRRMLGLPDAFDGMFTERLRCPRSCRSSRRDMSYRGWKRATTGWRGGLAWDACVCTVPPRRTRPSRRRPSWRGWATKGCAASPPTTTTACGPSCCRSHRRGPR